MLITDPATGGISGVHLMEVLDKLGIAEEMKGRLVPQPGGGFHAARVVKGEADLAVQAEHEIRCVKGATFLPYPAVFQRTIVFIGGVGAAAGDAAAAKAYLPYLTGAGDRHHLFGALPDAGLNPSGPQRKFKTNAPRRSCRGAGPPRRTRRCPSRAGRPPPPGIPPRRP